MYIQLRAMGVQRYENLAGVWTRPSPHQPTMLAQPHQSTPFAKWIRLNPPHQALNENPPHLTQTGPHHSYALFGCAEMIFGIELSDNSKFRMERKWLAIRILLFGWLEICHWNHRVVSISNSCLDVQTMELNILLSLDNIKLYTYINSHNYILKHIYILFCTHNNFKIIKIRWQYQDIK
jgi:hypothetical protein